jgi:serine/threonine protein kinase
MLPAHVLEKQLQSDPAHFHYLTDVPLSERIDFEWSIYNNKSEAFTQKRKETAHAFLADVFLTSCNDMIARLMFLKHLAPSKIAIPTMLDFMLTPINFIDEESFTPRPALSTKLRLLIEEVNHDIRRLNHQISQYNLAEGNVEKFFLLQDINATREMMDKKHPHDLISDCPVYRDEVYGQLFEDMKQQCAALGWDYLGATPTHLPSYLSTLKLPLTWPDFLTGIPPAKTRELANILIESNPSDFTSLATLYKPDEPLYEDYITMLHDHLIIFCGGKNTRNFKITSRKDHSSIVLRIGNPLDTPSSLAEAIATDDSTHVLTTNIARQRVISTDDSGLCSTRTMIITEFCAGGNLLSYSAIQSSHDNKLQSALKFYKQMGTILEAFTHKGWVFADPKNSNWIVDQSGHLRISDTKSFLTADSSGLIDMNSPANRWRKIIHTRHMCPPEFYSQPLQFDLDKMYSFMLGKNLYQYLTLCHSMELFEKNDADLYSFNFPIFDSAQGQQFLILIKQMVKPNPLDRISIREAIDYLNAIVIPLRPTDIRPVHKVQMIPPLEPIDIRQLQEAKEECFALLSQITTHKYFTKISIFDGFSVKQHRELIDSAENAEQLVDLKIDYEMMLETLVEAEVEEQGEKKEKTPLRRLSIFKIKEEEEKEEKDAEIKHKHEPQKLTLNLAG